MSEFKRTVHLVDDDEAIRRSASFMLRTSGYLVKTYASGMDLLQQCDALEPGCILMDVRMPGMDGLEVHKALLERGVTLPVIVMTGHGDVGLAVQAMKNGAVDFIEKPFERQIVVEAIEEGWARLEQADRHRQRSEDAKARFGTLTPRELDVLKGLVKGHPNKTIAFDLGISPRTVEIHRANLMAKLDVPSLSDVLRLAFAAGLGDDEEDGED